jgi:hypothetical protein
MSILPNNISWLTSFQEFAEFLSWQNVKLLRHFFLVSFGHFLTLLLLECNEARGRRDKVLIVFVHELLNLLFSFFNFIKFLRNDLTSSRLKLVDQFVVSSRKFDVGNFNFLNGLKLFFDLVSDFKFGHADFFSERLNLLFVFLLECLLSFSHWISVSLL